MTSARARSERSDLSQRVSRLVVLALALVSLPGCRPIVAWFGHDPARVTLVEVLDRRGRQRVVVDRVDGPWFDAVGVASLVFTGDGHVAYPARVGSRWHVVHDGELGPGYDGVGEVVMSPEGSRLIYAAARGEQWTVVVDGREQGEWSALAGGSLRLVVGASPRELRWSFIGYRGEDAFVVVDGAVVGPFDAARPALMDARRSAFATVRHERARVFIDGAAGVPFAQVRDLQLVEGRVAYLGHSATRSVVVLEGVTRGDHPALRHLRLHSSGRWFAIRSERLTPDAAEAIVLGEWPASTGPATPEEQRLADVAAVQHAAFLGDARVVWVGVTATGARLFVEGEAQAPHASIPELVTRDTRYAYIGERGGQHQVTIDGRPAASEAERIDSLVLSADGEVAYHTLRTLQPGSPAVDVIVAHGRHWPAPGFVEGSLVCLDDLPHCAHLARIDDELHIDIDGIHRISFDLEEAVASIARTANRPALGDDAWLRAWLAGELRWFITRE